MYYLYRKNKGTDQMHGYSVSCMITVQLICTFVLVYAKSRFSHDAALIIFNCKYSTRFSFLWYFFVTVSKQLR